jgi:hypothetical protein
MPKVFISYSWDNEVHKNWVCTLATRLRENGVETTLDEWHLVPGDQLPEFMERAVRESDYVLVICTARYKERSDSRSGGVGYEGDIITSEILTQHNHRKFIPVLREEPGSSMPSWLAGKFYIDLRGEFYSERQYNTLLTTMLGTRQEAPPVKIFRSPEDVDSQSDIFERRSSSLQEILRNWGASPTGDLSDAGVVRAPNKTATRVIL